MEESGLGLGGPMADGGRDDDAPVLGGREPGHSSPCCDRDTYCALCGMGAEAGGGGGGTL